jgi:hypothetical protein
MRRWIVLAAFALVGARLFFSCGPDPQREPASAPTQPELGLTETGRTGESFAAWCARLGVTCPPPPAANVPDADDPWTADEWRGVLATLRAVATGATHYTVTRAELDDANLTAAAEAFGLGDGLAKLRERLDASGFDHFDVGDSLKVTADGTNERVAPSGLVVETAEVLDVAVTPADGVAVQGLAVSGPGGAGSAVTGFDVSGTNVLTFGGPAGDVVDAPIKFLFDEAFGMGTDADAGAEAPDYQDMQPGFVPMKNWLVTGTRDLDLRADEIAAAKAHLPRLIRDQAKRQNVDVLLSVLTSLKSTAASRADKLVQAQARRGFVCVVGDSELTFATSFGVQNITQRGDAANVTLYGVKARRLSGLVRPQFALNRLELQPTKIVIYDVPVIGTFTIDMTDPDSAPSTVSCL